MTHGQRVALWDAINAVVAASGGRTGATGVQRQKAVVEVERAVAGAVADHEAEVRRLRAAIEAHRDANEPLDGEEWRSDADVDLYAALDPKEGGGEPDAADLVASARAAGRILDRPPPVPLCRICQDERCEAPAHTAAAVVSPRPCIVIGCDHDARPGGVHCETCWRTDIP